MFDRLRVMFFLVKSHSIKLVSRVFIWRVRDGGGVASTERTVACISSVSVTYVCAPRRLAIRSHYMNVTVVCESAICQLLALRWVALIRKLQRYHTLLTLSFTLCFAPLNIDLPVIKRLCVKSIALIGSRSIAPPLRISSNSSKVEFYS